VETPGLVDEYKRLRSGESPGLTNWGVLGFSGRDAIAFLHNFCTADLKSLRPGQGSEAFVLNAKGRILAFGIIRVQENTAQLIVPRDVVPAMTDHFSKYIIREDVELQDHSWSTRVCCFSFPQTESGKSNPGRVGWPDLFERSGWVQLVQSLRSAGYLSHVSLGHSGNGHGAVLIKTRVVSSEDCLMLIPAEQVADGKVKVGGSQIPLVSAAAFEVARVEQGFPEYGVDLTVDNLPQEIARDDLAISLNKGCYLGQETVARIDALGHVNKFLRQLIFETDEVPARGSEIMLGDKVVGRTGSTCWSPRHQSAIGLGIVRTVAASEGQAVSVSGNVAQVRVIES